MRRVRRNRVGMPSTHTYSESIRGRKSSSIATATNPYSNNKTPPPPPLPSSSSAMTHRRMSPPPAMMNTSNITSRNVMVAGGASKEKSKKVVEEEEEKKNVSFGKQMQNVVLSSLRRSNPPQPQQPTDEEEGIRSLSHSLAAAAASSNDNDENDGNYQPMSIQSSSSAAASLFLRQDSTTASVCSANSNRSTELGVQRILQGIQYYGRLAFSKNNNKDDEDGNDKNENDDETDQFFQEEENNDHPNDDDDEYLHVPATFQELTRLYHKHTYKLKSKLKRKLHDYDLDYTSGAKSIRQIMVLVVIIVVMVACFFDDGGEYNLLSGNGVEKVFTTTADEDVTVMNGKRGEGGVEKINLLSPEDINKLSLEKQNGGGGEVVGGRSSAPALSWLQQANEDDDEDQENTQFEQTSSLFSPNNKDVNNLSTQQQQDKRDEQQVSEKGEAEVDLDMSKNKKIQLGKSGAITKKEQTTPKNKKKTKQEEKGKIPIPSSLATLADLTTPYKKRPTLQKRVIVIPPSSSSATASDKKHEQEQAAEVEEEWNSIIVRNTKGEVPYFWDVHFSGESIAEKIFSSCYDLVQAAEHGLSQPDYNEEELEVFQTNNGKYVNVDTTTPQGLKRASKLQLAKSGLADVIISPSPHNMSQTIFTTDNPGRMFTLLRHPVDRAISMYYYLATASSDPLYNPKLLDMTLEEYANSASIENNWLTRFLVNKPGGKLSKEDMILAKEILKRKCLVGLYDDMEVSMAKFDRYFGWSEEEYNEDDNDDEDDEKEEKDGAATQSARKQKTNKKKKKKKKKEIGKCRKAFIEAGDKRHNHPLVEEGSKEWNMIVQHNRFDMELYKYAKVLYRVQGEQIFGVV